MRKILIGLIAGFAATIPMTLAMVTLHRCLPPQEQYPLPPEEIIEEFAEKIGVEEHRGEPEHQAVTLLAHFGFGSLMGGIYAPLSQKLPGTPVLRGMGYGVAVWAGNYLGLLPALRILRPATAHPPRRNGLMIVAHLIWGGALGTLVGKSTPPR